MSLTCNQKTLAEILGVSSPTVATLVAEGMPPLEHRGRQGADNRFDVAACVGWYLERVTARTDGPVAAARAEWLRIRTDRERLAYMRAAGQLCEVAAVQKVAFDSARVVRDSMMGIPDRVSPQLAGESDPVRIHEMLAGEIRLALTNLADRLPDELAKVDGAGAR